MGASPSRENPTTDPDESGILSAMARPPDAPTTALPDARRAPPAAVVAAVVAGPDHGRRAIHPIRIAMGSAEGNELQLNDPTVSRYHAELERTPAGLVVRDLGSRNGTFVGEVRVLTALVEPGTRLRLGQSIVALEDGRSEPNADPDIEVPSLVGVSAAMRQLRRLVQTLAASRVAVLIQGETGTGKELVARALHDLSPRSSRPFVTVDCGSLPPTLVASELFGHERGSFTGALKRHVGAFERASGGTVFLDEIGDLPPEIQPALLGVLERRRIRRVGGSEDIPVDVRVVSATHRDLRGDANEATFRSDLYFRIATARLVIPPLRERREDVAPIARSFAREIAGSTDLFSEAALRSLAALHFRGNVRELRNIVETSLAMGRLVVDPTLTEASPSGAPGPPGLEEGHALPLSTYAEARTQALSCFEQAYFRRLLEESRGNVSLAARRAGMDRSWMLEILKRNGLRS
jgi:DNA-binding NtrC family response regulator